MPPLSHRLRNTLHTALLLAAMAALAGSLGWLLFGPEGLVWAAMAAALVTALTPRFSPRWVLRMLGAREIPPWQAPVLHDIVARLAERAELPRAPRLFYIATRALNAFATGERADSAISLTDGLLRALTLRELAGVLAHEIAHIRDRDLWVMSLADVVARVTALMSLAGQTLLAVMLPLALLQDTRLPLAPLAVLILAPSVSLLLQLALARSREYRADLGAVELTGDPAGLASALDKIERLQGGWMERMFMAGGRIPAWLRTHPRTRERIRRLLELESAYGERQPFAAAAPEPLYELPVVVRRPRWHWYGLWH